MTLKKIFLNLISIKNLIKKENYSVTLDEQFMYHYYLSEAVLNSNSNESVGDVFGIGEDCFVMLLREYSLIFWRVFHDAHIRNADFKGIPVYESPGHLATFFWSEVNNINNNSFSPLPDLGRWELAVKKELKKLNL